MPTNRKPTKRTDRPSSGPSRAKPHTGAAKPASGHASSGTAPKPKVATKASPSTKAGTGTHAGRPTKRGSGSVGAVPRSGTSRRPQPRQKDKATLEVPATATETPARKSGADRPGSDAVVRRLIVIGIAVASVLLVVLVGFLILSYTPAFTITDVDAVATEHISKDNIIKLAKVPDGATLLNLDEDQITENLKKNPWVESVTYERDFPNKLTIVVKERKVDSLVVMSTGNVVWYMGEDNVWIEPASIEVGENDDIDDLALKEAQSMGAMLITDVPSSVEPVAGSAADSSILDAVQEYRDDFSDELSDQIVSFSASSLESISCTLESGVEISLGSPSNISSKEAVILELLDKYEGKLTYINVRVPSSPTYRMVDSDTVESGSGVSGTEYETTDDSSSSDTSDSSGSDTSTSDASTSATDSTSTDAGT